MNLDSPKIKLAVTASVYEYMAKDKKPYKLSTRAIDRIPGHGRIAYIQ
jgi:hypothetical protein